MVGQREETISTMLADLEKEEQLLAEADEALGRALAKYRVAAARYVAVRESIAEYLGHSPYDQPVWMLWPNPEQPDWPRSHGLYRFLNKEPGVAVDEVLKNSPEPLTVYKILELVKSGGLKAINEKPIDGRTINAVLQANKMVKKDQEGRYFYDKGEDLPF